MCRPFKISCIFSAGTGTEMSLAMRLALAVIVRTGAGCGYLSNACGTTRPQSSRFTSMHARSSACMAVSGHTPFSKRAEDSVRMPSVRDVTRLLPRSNAAHSNSTRRVPSVISLSSPPMMPARPVAFSLSAITSMLPFKTCSLPSSVVRCSPSLARRTTMVCSRTLSRSKACMGWPVSSMMKLVMSTMLLMGRTPAP